MFASCVVFEGYGRLSLSLHDFAGHMVHLCLELGQVVAEVQPPLH